MATIAPPPSKRQKIAALEKAEKVADERIIPAHLGSVRVQFVDQTSGKTTGPVVAVPLKDATVKNLETLLNTIQGNVRFDRTGGTFTSMLTFC
jgi:ribosome assembly protein 4